MPALSLDGELLRRAARWGARGPEWFVRAAPPVVGVLAWALAADERRTVERNLRRVRGVRGTLRDAVDGARTFSTYASCLAEILGAGSARGRLPEVVVHGELHVRGALALRRGVILATAHTAGWETVGPVLTRDLGLRVMIAEAAERDTAASAIQDDARRAHGLLVAHVGEDPLSALPLARHLGQGDAVALQIDRLPRGQRRRSVVLFGSPAHVPEGPLKLAALTGAPLVPIFAARTGYRRYLVVASEPIGLARDAGADVLDAAAQRLAGAMEAFLQAHPTQWFHFHDA